ncbi:hypothetical protein [Parerythrobacter jejuensis]|uniref:Uncharacterized protein n=1 Tax=Parerythrobacter jejuensis TaxID=795812 RepID=A0A845B0Y1_9SPHN|nr:hypothetical protein [Parerythrobacter jejuensis]MXP32648.1 hypothetical protein [Parerythrobacter jejuensis]
MRRFTLNMCVLTGLVVPASLVAQDMPGDPPAGPASEAAEGATGAQLTPERLAAYESWSAEQRTQYDAWPGDTQAYYWTLSPPRQEVFWRISDNDKLALTAMSEPDRAAAWEMVEERMLSNDPPVSSGPEGTQDMAADDAQSPPDPTPPLLDDKAEPRGI